jgi:hypothetical protein
MKRAAKRVGKALEGAGSLLFFFLFLFFFSSDKAIGPLRADASPSQDTSRLIRPLAPMSSGGRGVGAGVPDQGCRGLTTSLMERENRCRA